MGSSYRIRKVLYFLVDCKSPWIAMERRDGLYSMAKSLISRDWYRRGWQR